MAGGESTSDEKLDGPAAMAGALASPFPPREDSSPPENQDQPGTAKEQHVISESSEDDEHDNISETHDDHHPHPHNKENLHPTNSGPPPEKSPSTRAQSIRPSSFAGTTAVVVPRSQRRGLFGRLTLIPEVERPYEYKTSTKWVITAIVALAAAGAPMGSSIFMREFI